MSLFLSYFPSFGHPSNISSIIPEEHCHELIYYDNDYDNNNNNGAGGEEVGKESGNLVTVAW